MGIEKKSKKEIREEFLKQNKKFERDGFVEKIALIDPNQVVFRYRGEHDQR